MVLASNLPALAVQPLLPALAARRPVLLKSPSAEPWFADSFVRALVRRLPALAGGVAAATWRGGDEAVEGPILARTRTVLAYGGDEALASLARRAAQAGVVRVAAYGARTSLAALAPGAELGPAATGIARDVALFDQRGCLSVAAVYVAGDEARSGELARALAGELGRLARRWPPGPAEAAELAGVRQVRSEAALRGLAVFPAAGDPEDPRGGTVVVEPRPAFRPTPGLRTVRVHPLADLRGAARRPRPLARPAPGGGARRRSAGPGRGAPRPGSVADRGPGRAPEPRRALAKRRDRSARGPLRTS